MDDQHPGEPGLSDELRQLGRNLKTVLEAAWESEERRRLQTELASALEEVATALSSSAHDMLNSPAAQKFHDEVEAWREKIRQSDLSQQVHSELLDALRRVNAQLSGLAERWRAAHDDLDRPGVSGGAA